MCERNLIGPTHIQILFYNCLIYLIYITIVQFQTKIREQFLRWWWWWWCNSITNCVCPAAVITTVLLANWKSKNSSPQLFNFFVYKITEMRTFHNDLWLWVYIIMDHVLRGAMVASTSQMSAILLLPIVVNKELRGLGGFRWYASKPSFIKIGERVQIWNGRTGLRQVNCVTRVTDIPTPCCSVTYNKTVFFSVNIQQLYYRNMFIIRTCFG
jgi:hypothetical protein